MTRNDPPWHAHVLRGCAPRPLGAYLKALGVLRVLAEQKDPQARGRWQDDAFVLITRLDRDALLSFFLREWQPSPFISPWNKGSGLLGEDEKGVLPLQRSVAPRFALSRQGIAQARALTEAMAQAVRAEKAVKDEKTRLKDRGAKERLAADPAYKQRLAQAARTCKRLKDELQPECQRRFRGPALRWLRAAVVLTEDGGATFPALLGTGGNDGKLDFTNNAMQRLGDLFDLASPDGAPRDGALPALRAALFGEAERGLIGGGIGQYAPASSGGPNATAGALGESLLNPWDLPLLLEGALLFTAGTSRRLGGAGSERTVAPFSARAGAAGYGSAAPADESARGEQWMPLWARPLAATEVEALLREGRCQINARASDSSLDVARAIARLGVARGITAFERYGFLERNGKSNYAVPLGRWPVQAEPRAPLLDDLEGGDWWERLRRAARDKRAPQRLVWLERRLEDLLLGALAHGGEPARWQAALQALAEVEAQLVESGAFTVSKRLQPLPRLQPGWIEAADDGGPALRLALALAGAGEDHTKAGWPVDAVRGHFLPLDPRTGRFAAGERALANDPRVVILGRDAAADLIRLVQRRLIEAGAGAGRTLPLRARPGTEAPLADLAALLRGEVDLTKTLWLARALSALDWGAYQAAHRPACPAATKGAGALIDPVWAVVRLGHLPGPLRLGTAEVRVPVDPAAVRLLAAGDAPRAFALVRQRLAAAGLLCPLRLAVADQDLSRRLAASLAFPISAHDCRRLALGLNPLPSSSSQESSHAD